MMQLLLAMANWKSVQALQGKLAFRFAALIGAGFLLGCVFMGQFHHQVRATIILWGIHGPIIKWALTAAGALIAFAVGGLTLAASALNAIAHAQDKQQLATLTDAATIPLKPAPEVKP